MRLQDARLVMFDLDGTLVDSALDLHTALNGTLDSLGVPTVDISSTRQWVGNGAAVLVNRALHGSLNAPKDHPRLPEALPRFLKVYSEVNGLESKCYQGAAELVTSLRAAGCKVAVVTNKPCEPACVLLSKLGMEVDAVIGGDSLPERKPSPLPLEACMKRFGVAPEDAVMVGDSSNDFLAAAAAGVFCVGVSYGYNHGVSVRPEQVGRLVDSLTELR